MSRGVPVRVNCYDLLKANNLTRRTKICVYHTTVVIDERFEVYYGFRQFGLTGIDYAVTIDEIAPSMTGTFYTTFPLGRTKRSLAYCKSVIKDFCADARWLSERYNAIYNNCHTFAYLLCEACLGEGNLHEFPMFVFQSDEVSEKVYKGILRHFIDVDNPPYFLGRPVKRGAHLLMHSVVQAEQCPEIVCF
jgi:hypothetical protein